jgi:hypothetical protein
MNDLVPDTRRQASHIFRGYTYQAYQTILAWLKSAPDVEIITEFAEDIDLVRRDAMGKVTEVELNQVKHEKGTVTLNSSAAIALITNFFEHNTRNQQLSLTIRLCTISDRGKERGIDWIFAENGMDLWDLIRNRQLKKKDHCKALAIVKSFYLEKNNLPDQLQKFLKTSSDSTFLSDFVDRIWWDTGQNDFYQIEREIKDLLGVYKRPIIDELEVNQTIRRLWHHVTHVIADHPGGILNKKTLEEILNEETTARIDRETMMTLSRDVASVKLKFEDMQGLLTSFLHPQEPGIPSEYAIKTQVESYLGELPPLPKFCAERSTVISDFASLLVNSPILWIRGSTGYGKTTLANLLVHHLSVSQAWFRLRGYSDFTLTSALTKIAYFLERQSSLPKVVVLDDLSLGLQNTQAIELVLKIVRVTAGSNTKTLVTSQFRPPLVLRNQLDDILHEIQSPEMSDSEVSSMLELAGLTDDGIKRLWGNYILAATSGHPQLVGAYVIYASQINWALTPNLLTQQPRSVAEVREEGRRLLGNTIAFDEAREMARRLSLLIGSFDREFALLLAAAPPRLKEPGRAFDILEGPWIESHGNGLHSLSPLLKGYAEADVGESALDKYYIALCYAWLRKKALTPSEIVQAMVASLRAKIDPLITKISSIPFVVDAETFQAISKELSLLSHLYIGGTDRLNHIHPLTRSLFRYFQLKISETNEDWDTYLKIDARFKQEISEIGSNDSLSDLCSWLFLIEGSIRLSTPLPPRKRVSRALRAIDIVHSNRTPEIVSMFAPDRAQLGNLVMIAASSITTHSDLDYLLEELEKRGASVIAEIFDAYADFPEGMSLMIDNVWYNESMKADPDWSSCVFTFSKCLQFADRHIQPWLIAGAIRGLMVIHDEYLDDSKTALRKAVEGRALLSGSHPLIDIQEATLHFRAEHHKRVVTITKEIEASLSPDTLSTLRIFSLRRSILSADKLGSWDIVIQMAKNGLDISPFLYNDLMRDLASMCFEAEIGWAKNELGELTEAVQHFKNVLEKMEKYPDQNYPLFHIFHIRFGSALAYLNSIWKSDHLIVRLNTTAKKPFAGMFANFDPPHKEASNHPLQPYSVFWAFLSKFAASIMNKDSHQLIANRAISNKSKEYNYLAQLEGYHSLFLNALVTRNFDRAIKFGSKYSKLLACLPDRSADPSRAFEPEDNKRINPKSISSWAETFLWLVLEPILMAIYAMDVTVELPIIRGASCLEDPLRSQIVVLDSIKWLEKTVYAISGDNETLENIRRAARSNTGAESANRLSTLALCGSKNITINDTLSAQFGILSTINQKIQESHWILFYHDMIRTRWSFLVKHQKFLLKTPNYWSKTILEALLSSSPKIPDLARILLLVGEATGANWPSEMLGRLKDYANS